MLCAAYSAPGNSLNWKILFCHEQGGYTMAGEWGVEEGEERRRMQEGERGRKREKSSYIEPEDTSSCDSLRDGHTSGTWNDNLALCKVNQKERVIQ